MQMNAPADRRLGGRVAVVTGAARPQGIGRAICLRFAQEGALVAVLDIDGEGALRLAEEIATAGGEAIGVACDVRDLAACEAAAARVTAQWGRADILVNNAAKLENVDWQPFDAWTVEEWDEMLDVNLRGMWFCARVFVPLMKAQGYGKIVNVTSSTFWEGVGGFIHYTSSKGGVIGFTRALGRELGPSGIRVNALAPGYTMTDTQVDHASAHPEHAMAMREQRALARDETPDDLAGPAFFLASADSDFMTCQTVLVDGGRSMW
jgi:NAD(P)-dependent dehydrogenase (short-subunit alcohol dehydrogenase family)